MIAFALLVLAFVPVFLTQEYEGFQVANRVLNFLGLSSAYKDCFVAPYECPNYNISFYLYTRDTAKTPQVLNASNPESLKNAKFLKGRPVKVLIHGYTGDVNYSPNTEIRPVYLKYSDVNVISVDYGPLAREPCYVWATYNVALVANCTAKLIDSLVAYGKVPLADFHVVGFSLGAQVAGHIANFIKSGKLQRVTGLDPALPLFMGANEQKLDSSDALFVDVMHTNAGRRGKVDASGHVDFYVNGGTHQPGCDAPEIDSPSSCSHVRAPILFAESIYSTLGFWGFPCPGYLTYFFGWCTHWDGRSRLELMGEYVNQSASGIYFVTTNKRPPYAQGPMQKVIAPQALPGTSHRQPRVPPGRRSR